MSTLTDEDIKNQDIDPAARQARDMFQNGEQQAATKTPAEQAAEDQRNAPADAAQNQDAIADLDNAWNIPYTGGGGSGELTDLDTIDSSIRGKLSSWANRIVGGISRNKGKSAATVLTVGAVVTLGMIGGGTLSLVSAKNNAEKKYNSITSTVLDSRYGKLAFYARSKALASVFKSLQLEANTTKLAKAMDEAGYELVTAPDGKVSLVLPAAEGADAADRVVLTEAADVQNEIKGIANETLPGGSIKNLRARSKAAKLLNKKLGIGTSAAVDGLAAGLDERVPDDEVDAAVTQNARKQTMEPQEGESEITTKNREDLGDALDSGDKQAAEEGKDALVENGAKQAEDNIARDIVEESSEEVLQNTGKSVLSSVGGTLKGALPDILDRSCQAGDAARAALVLALINKRANLIKIASVTISNADAIITGRVDARLLKAYMNTIQKDPKSGKSWTQSAGMRFMNGDATAKPSAAERNYFSTNRDGLATNAFLQFLVALSSKEVAGKNVCNIIQNPASQAGLSVGEYAVQAVVGFFSAGTGTAAIAATEAGAKQALSKVIAEALGKALVKGLVAEAAMYVGTQWLKSYASNVFSSTMTTFSKKEGGPTAGNAFGAGSGALYEARGRNQGMRPLTRLAYVDLSRQVRAEQRQEMAKAGLFDRFISLKPSNSNSLLATALTQSPIAWQNPGDVITASIHSLASLSPLQQAQAFASTTLSGSAYAQDGNVQTDDNGYVVDPWGNYIVGNQLDDIDPVQNFNALQNKGMLDSEGAPKDGSRLQKYISDCAEVDIHTSDTTNNVKSLCVSSEARSYQAYLADYTNASGIDAAYHPVYAEEDTAPTSTPSGQATGDAGVDTSGLPCPAGTEDGGVQQDYGPGRVATVKIKICGIPGAIPSSSGVNASAAKGALAMITAAKQDGVTLSGSSFRSYDRQKELRVAHGCADDSLKASACRPPTARPGNSQHEVGLAIDFDSCRTRSTRCYQWLSGNAGKFGFKNLPSEPWHWSTSGS